MFGNGVIGIRREDKNVWERRTPLVPDHVRHLIKTHNLRVIVQPSPIRCHDDDAYADAGAEISEDLSPCGTVFAVKEVPPALLLPDRTYVFFSHTIKAQPYNMPLLDTALAHRVRLIDYERITNQDGRIVKFGPYAGYAGMVDTLHAAGVAAINRGYATPFLHTSYAKEYRSLDSARADLLACGEIIRTRGIPEALAPFVFVVTGNGSVSMAAQQMLHCLPCKYVTPEGLAAVTRAAKPDRHNVYVCVVSARSFIVGPDGKPLTDTAAYYKNPTGYGCVFAEKVLPHTSVLVNGIYWEERFPRLVTADQLRDCADAHKLRLLAVGDISCDVGGSLEFTVRDTPISEPVFWWDPSHRCEVPPGEAVPPRAVPVMAVSHLPAEFPREASRFFGDALLPMVPEIAQAKNYQELSAEVHRAVVCDGGALTPTFSYIADIRAAREAEEARVAAHVGAAGGRKRVVVFGAGMCAGPCVEHLLKDPDYDVVLCDASAQALAELRAEFAPHAGEQRLQTVEAHVEDAGHLDALVKGASVVVSLVPWAMHAKVFAPAVARGVPVVTASYENPAMQQFNSAALSSGTTLLNEAGLDPGIDNISALALLAEIKAAGGVVESFESFCGALPSPECADNPIGFRFAWSPAGVVAAAVRPASFSYGGHVCEIPAEALLSFAVPFRHVPALELVGLPNGNSNAYRPLLGLEGAHTVVRGTLRYPAYMGVMRAAVDLGLLAEKAADVPPAGAAGQPLEALVRKGVAARAKAVEHLASTCAGLTAYLKGSGGVAPGDSPEKVVSGLRELGLEALIREVQAGAVANPREEFVRRLSSNPALRLGRGDVDAVIMHHRVVATYEGGTHRRVHTASLFERGASASRTATAKLVGVPLAVATQLVASGRVALAGLCRVTHPKVYPEMHSALKKLGIELRERVVDVPARK